jgi:predicted SnoaL-like aldol condensation-catalyzing enzyme
MKYTILTLLTMITSIFYSQQKTGIDMTNQEIVIKFLDGFNNPAQIHESLNLLADDYRFKNPMVELNSKTEFISLAQEIGKVLTGVNIISSAENGEWVAVYYEFTSSIPEVESNLASEWFRLENGLIKESHLIYDASKWRKIYEKMER